jgi:PTH1 family peptidyl-tRNA hydrolase
MRLLVGLGNPGSKYKNHRHNIGFMALDEIIERHNFSTPKNRWQSIAYEGRLGSEKIIAIKPQTYMNESGRAVGEAMRFFKASPADVIVFYDELDLAFGKIKAKIGGGAAGHNGIRSISAHIGAEYTRVRMGIGHPGHKDRVHGHVLGDFAKAEQDILHDMLNVVATETEWLVKDDLPRFMSEVARYMSPTAATEVAKKSDKGQAQSKPALKQETKEGPMASMLRALKGDK